MGADARSSLPCRCYKVFKSAFKKTQFVFLPVLENIKQDSIWRSLSAHRRDFCIRRLIFQHSREEIMQTLTSKSSHQRLRWLWWICDLKILSWKLTDTSYRPFYIFFCLDQQISTAYKKMKTTLDDRRQNRRPWLARRRRASCTCKTKQIITPTRKEEVSIPYFVEAWLAHLVFWTKLWEFHKIVDYSTLSSLSSDSVVRNIAIINVPELCIAKIVFQADDTGTVRNVCCVLRKGWSI